MACINDLARLIIQTCISHEKLSKKAREKNRVWFVKRKWALGFRKTIWCAPTSVTDETILLEEKTYSAGIWCSHKIDVLKKFKAYKRFVWNKCCSSKLLFIKECSGCVILYVVRPKWCLVKPWVTRKNSYLQHILCMLFIKQTVCCGCCCCTPSESQEFIDGIICPQATADLILQNMILSDGMPSTCSSHSVHGWTLIIAYVVISQNCLRRLEVLSETADSIWLL